MNNNQDLTKAILKNIVERQVISKKDLCFLLGIPRTGQKTRGRTIRGRYLTDDILTEMNCSIDYYNKIKIFDKCQTRIIIERLKLDKFYPPLAILIIPY